MLLQFIGRRTDATICQDPVINVRQSVNAAARGWDKTSSASMNSPGGRGGIGIKRVTSSGTIQPADHHKPAGLYVGGLSGWLSFGHYQW